MRPLEAICHMQEKLPLCLGLPVDDGCDPDQVDQSDNDASVKAGARNAADSGRRCGWVSKRDVDAEDVVVGREGCECG